VVVQTSETKLFIQYKNSVRHSLAQIIVASYIFLLEVPMEIKFACK
jgi:hypothetical protein